MKKTFKHNLFTATFSDEGTGRPDNRYFSFTGEINGTSGACGSTIAEVYPAFKPLDDLHLSTLDGAPMYPLENAFYHLKDAGYDPAALEKYWRVKFSIEQKADLKKYSAFSQKLLREYIKNLMEECRPTWKAQAAAALKLAQDTPSDLTEIDDTKSLDDYDQPAKVRALAAFLGVHFSTIDEGDDDYMAQGIKYMVYTDEEADAAQVENLENVLEHCILLDLPETARDYFNRAAWIEDAKIDGRGHNLASYDGEENEITDPETKQEFFAYRQ